MIEHTEILFDKLGNVMVSLYFGDIVLSYALYMFDNTIRKRNNVLGEYQK